MPAMPLERRRPGWLVRQPYDRANSPGRFRSQSPTSRSFQPGTGRPRTTTPLSSGALRRALVRTAADVAREGEGSESDDLSALTPT
jgi:hypothetical protein